MPLPPPVPSPLSDEQVRQNMRRWELAMTASHEMLMAGLRDRIGPDGDVQQAYRRWQQQHSDAKFNELSAVAAARKKRSAEATDGP